MGKSPFLKSKIVCVWGESSMLFYFDLRKVFCQFVLFIGKKKLKNTYNFYLVIEIPDDVYVLVGKI